MTRSEILRAARAQGATTAQGYTLDYLTTTGRLTPAPTLDGSNRRIYLPSHVDQVVAYVTRKVTT